MNFQDINYRNHITNFVETKKARGEKYSFQLLAQKIGIQKPYLSKVLAGNANLSSDQLYLLINEMELNEEEEKFFWLIWEHERSGLKARKDKLKEEIKTIQRNNLKSEKHLKVESSETISIDEMSEYYLNPLNQIIHISLGLKQYQSNYQNLIHDLSISLEQLNKSLSTLERLGLIEWGEKIKLLKRNIHLPRESHLFWSWKTQLNLLGLSKCQQLTTDDTYNFSVVFSCTEKAKSEIQAEYFKFINKVQSIVSDSKGKHVFQLNYDLFKWL